jgi:hypothetical protein
MAGSSVVLAVAEVISLIILTSGVIQDAVFCAQFVISACALFAWRPANLEALWRQYANAAPSLSVIVPAFNERTTIVYWCSVIRHSTSLW